MSCAHQPIEASLDRWHECHWHLHQMEANYHEPDPFRYSLNSFIRAIADVPEMLTKNLERHEPVRRVIKPRLKEMESSELFAILRIRRNFIVHQGMLAVQSQGSVGTVEGSRIKLQFPFRVEPWESSDEAYERYKHLCRSNPILRGLGPDCDSAPAIWRTWMIPQIPERDLLEVAFEAWKLVGDLLSMTVVQLGGQALDLTMPCRHDPSVVRIKYYSQSEFFMSVDGIDLAEEERKCNEEHIKRNAMKPVKRIRKDNY